MDVKTETHRDWDICWMSRPRLIETKKFLGCRDRDSSRLRNFLDVETETHRDWENSWMSRPRLIETEKILGCWDRDHSRLGNAMDVETMTSRDRAKDVDTVTPSKILLISGPEPAWPGPEPEEVRPFSWSHSLSSPAQGASYFNLLVWNGDLEKAKKTNLVNMSA